MKKLLDRLVKKYWKKYDKDIIGAGFSCECENDIKNEIDSFLENILAEKYNFEEYETDSDSYVKFTVKNEILKLISKEISKYTNYDYPTPKRFYQPCGPRD